MISEVSDIQVSTMNEEIELLKTVAARLDRVGIAYMMTGSMALAVYSTPRMTRDIDMILQISTADIPTVISLFKDDFYIEESSVRQAVRDSSMFNIIHNDTVIKIDLIIRKNEQYRIEEFARRQIVEIGGVSVYVVSAEDLILSKLVWGGTAGSQLQFRDVQQILRDVLALDWNYLVSRAQLLGVGSMLEKARNHA